MITLSTTAQQREYIIDALNTTMPLTASTMETIQGEINFDLIAKRLRRLQELEKDLALVNGTDESIEALIASLKRANDEDLEEIKTILDRIKTQAGKEAINKAKQDEYMADGKRRIADLADSLNAKANQLGSVKLADLSRAVKSVLG